MTLVVHGVKYGIILTNLRLADLQKDDGSLLNDCVDDKCTPDHDEDGAETQAKVKFLAGNVAEGMLEEESLSGNLVELFDWFIVVLFLVGHLYFIFVRGCDVAARHSIEDRFPVRLRMVDFT